MKFSRIQPSIVLFLVVLLSGCSSIISSFGGASPSAPTGLDGESGDKVITLTWDANSEEDLAGYNLYRSKDSFSDISGMNPVNGSSLLSDTNYTDTGLQNGSTYYYRLTSVDQDTNESTPSFGIAATPFSNPPDRP